MMRINKGKNPVKIITGKAANIDKPQFCDVPKNTNEISPSGDFLSAQHYKGLA